MIHSLLVGAGSFVESLQEGLKAQGHLVARAEPVRPPDTPPLGSDLDSPATGIKEAVDLLGHADLIVHVPAVPGGPKNLVNQTADEWITACKGGATPPSCHFDYGGPLTETVLLGNAAYRAGTSFEWDAENLRARGTDKIDRYLRDEYRAGWEVS